MIQINLTDEEAETVIFGMALLHKFYDQKNSPARKATCRQIARQVNARGIMDSGWDPGISRFGSRLTQIKRVTITSYDLPPRIEED